MLIPRDNNATMTTFFTNKNLPYVQFLFLPSFLNIQLVIYFGIVFYITASLFLAFSFKTVCSLSLTGIWGPNFNQCGMYTTDIDLTVSCLSEMLHSGNLTITEGLEPRYSHFSGFVICRRA